VQHHLIAAPVSFFGDGSRVLVQRKHGKRQRVMQSEHLIDSRGIAAHIIEDDRQLWQCGSAIAGRTRGVVLGCSASP
jgi:hypothetical protein